MENCIKYKNIFYFRRICKIGGTEQFLYEIAKAYHNKNDITIMYDNIADNQLARLRPLVRCIKHTKGKAIKCEKAFLNFNIDAIDDIEADEYIFVAHANFEELGYKPPIADKRITRYIGVSKFACEKLEKYALDYFNMKIKCELSYNPLSIENTDKVIHMITACRLEDKVKGGARVKRLIEAMDQYCVVNDRHYVLDIYSNSPGVSVDSKNVNFKHGRIDIRPFIKDADYLLQLSNDMETYCYSTNEAWMLGTHTITTPFTVNKELPIPKEANYILEYDCSNVDDVVRHIFEDELKPFTYKPPKDSWSQILAKGETKYQNETKGKYIIEAQKSFFDLDNNIQRQLGDQWEVDYFRMLELVENPNNLVKCIKGAKWNN